MKRPREGRPYSSRYRPRLTTGCCYVGKFYLSGKRGDPIIIYDRGKPFVILRNCSERFFRGEEVVFEVKSSSPSSRVVFGEFIQKYSEI